MDPDAFHTLAVAELDAVYRFAFHLSRHRPEAEDLVQETYFLALRACGTFVPAEHGVRPWLFKILHNVVNSRLAKGRRDRVLLERYGVERETARDGSTDVWADPSPDRSGEIDWDRVDGRLKIAVLDLPLAYRTVFLLAAVEGLRYREIADLVEVPIGTVMSRLSRARRMLAGQLTDLAAEHNLRGRTHDGRVNEPDETEVGPAT